MISFHHIRGTNMLSVLSRGKSVDYQITAIILYILNNGKPRGVLESEFINNEEPKRMSLIEDTYRGWRPLSDNQLKKSFGIIAIYMGNNMMLIPEIPITYQELDARGEFNRFLVSHQHKPTRNRTEFDY